MLADERKFIVGKCFQSNMTADNSKHFYWISVAISFIDQVKGQLLMRFSRDDGYLPTGFDNFVQHSIQGWPSQKTRKLRGRSVPSVEFSQRNWSNWPIGNSPLSWLVIWPTVWSKLSNTLSLTSFRPYGNCWSLVAPYRLAAMNLRYCFLSSEGWNRAREINTIGESLDSIERVLQIIYRSSAIGSES